MEDSHDRTKHLRGNILIDSQIFLETDLAPGQEDLVHEIVDSVLICLALFERKFFRIVEPF